MLNRNWSSGGGNWGEESTGGSFLGMGRGVPVGLESDCPDCAEEISCCRGDDPLVLPEPSQRRRAGGVYRGPALHAVARPPEENAEAVADDVLRFLSHLDVPLQKGLCLAAMLVNLQLARQSTGQRLSGVLTCPAGCGPFVNNAIHMGDREEVWDEVEQRLRRASPMPAFTSGSSRSKATCRSTPGYRAGRGRADRGVRRGLSADRLGGETGAGLDPARLLRLRLG